MIFNRWCISVARLIHWQLHVWARISMTSLFSVVLPVWSNYQNCYYWLHWSLKPGTHWRQSWIQHSRLCWKSTVSARKLTVPATKSTVTSCRIQVVADLLPKPATKLTISATVDFVADCCQFRQQSTFNKVHRVEFNFVASVYRA